MNDLDVFALNDADRIFLRNCGVEVPSDAAWPIDGDECNGHKADVLILSSPKAAKRCAEFELSILNPDLDWNSESDATL